VRRPTLDDVPDILAVVHASDIAAIGYPDFTVDDVREVLTAPTTDLEQDCWVALDPAGEIVGWSYLDNPNRGERELVEVYVHPERGVPAQRPLLALALPRAAERAVAFGLEQMTLRAGAILTERTRIETLKDAGFAFVKRYARMSRSLDGVSPTPPAPPDGVTIRLLRHTDEADMRRFHYILDTAFADTPDHAPSTYEMWRERVDALPAVEWDEWFVAEVDGVAAGALRSTYQPPEEDEGWVRSLAVLREYRKRGVGAALLARAFAVYAGKGRKHAGLGVDLTNPTHAYRLYGAVGMTASYEFDSYERTI